jgi:hypothetical protein
MVVRGGSEIGKGVYGCVFDPPLKCKSSTVQKVKKSKSKENRISKLTLRYDGQREITVSSLLKDLPNSDEYFVGIEEFCSPEEVSKQTDSDLTKCDVLKTTKYKELILLKMPYAGVTVDKNKRLFNANYMKFGQHLLEAASLLLTKKLVHFDLHRNNVLITDLPRIIDFGYVWCPDNLGWENVETNGRVYNPVIDQESPETTYMNGLLAKNTKQFLIQDILKRKHVLQLIQNVLGVSYQTLEAQFKFFLDNSIVIQNKDYVNFYKQYWNKFDAWALGAMLTTLLSIGVFEHEFASKVYTPNKQKLLQVLRGLTHLDPSERFDAIEALQLWNPNSSVLKLPSVIAWIDVRDRSKKHVS